MRVTSPTQESLLLRVIRGSCCVAVSHLYLVLRLTTSAAYVRLLDCSGTAADACFTLVPNVLSAKFWLMTKY